MGADLPIITSEAQSHFIWDLSRKQETVTEYGVWIGLHRGEDDEFYWINGTEFSPGGHFYWGETPDNYKGEEDCVHIKEGKWNDLRCDSYGDVFKAPVVVCMK